MSRNGQWRKIRGALPLGIALMGSLLGPGNAGARGEPAPLANPRPSGDRPGFHPIDLSRGHANSVSNYLAPPSANPWPRGSQNLEGVPFQMDCHLEVSGLEAARRGELVSSPIIDMTLGRNGRGVVVL